MNAAPGEKTPNTAIVIDQSEIFRLGVEQVLTDLDFLVVGSTARVSDGIRIARTSASELFIVGKTPDLKHQNALKVMKSMKHAPKVMFLLDQAGQPDVARLISRHADALLLHTASVTDLSAAIKGVTQGERVVAPALAAGTIGRVGPNVEVTPAEAAAKSGLSAREIDVLSELASGSTYDEIAETLIVTKATVKTHLIHIYDKLGVKNRNQAVARALALGILS